jgi:hypothetical protein
MYVHDDEPSEEAPVRTCYIIRGIFTGVLGRPFEPKGMRLAVFLCVLNFIADEPETLLVTILVTLVACG